MVKRKYHKLSSAPLMFTLGYLVLYYIIHIGKNNQWNPNSLVVNYLCALLPYLALVKLFQLSKTAGVLLSVCSLPIVFLFSYTIAKHSGITDIRLYADSVYPMMIVLGLYGVLFFFIRFSHYKAMAVQEKMIVQKQAALHDYRTQLSPDWLFPELDQIEQLIQAQSPEALEAITKLSARLRAIVYIDDQHEPV